MTFDKVGNISAYCKNILVAMTIFFQGSGAAQVTSSESFPWTPWYNTQTKQKKAHKSWEKKRFKVLSQRVRFPP